MGGPLAGGPLAGGPLVGGLLAGGLLAGGLFVDFSPFTKHPGYPDTTLGYAHTSSTPLVISHVGQRPTRP